MTIIIVNKDVIIACEVWNRGNQAWGHEARCFYKGVEVEKARARYYNRTWERYQFESVMLELVDRLDYRKSIPLSDRIAMYKKIKE